MGHDAPYPHQNRADERHSTFDDIRRRPLATYLTVASVLKRMWDLEADADGSPAEAAGSAWTGLRGHLEAMLSCAAEHLSVDRPDHSVRDEWLHERGDNSGRPISAATADSDGPANSSPQPQPPQPAAPEPSKEGGAG